MFGGSMVALVTPMKDDGSLDLEALGRLVEYHVEQGTDGLVIGGTTGESPCIEPDELAAMIRAALEAADGRVPVIGGSGTNSTRRTVELTAVVREAGAAAALVVTPYYNKPVQQGLFEHYRTVAERAGLPVIHYNVPGRTACDMQPETVARLAEVPGILGLKEAVPGTERVTRIRGLVGDRLELFSGDDGTAMAFMLAGGDGVISVTANVAPRLMHGLCEAARHGEPRKAEAINDRLDALHRALFEAFSALRSAGEVERMGLIGGGIRLPLTPLAEEHQDTVRRAMARAGVETRT